MVKMNRHRIGNRNVQHGIAVVADDQLHLIGDAKGKLGLHHTLCGNASGIRRTPPIQKIESRKDQIHQHKCGNSRTGAPGSRGKHQYGADTGN